MMKGPKAAEKFWCTNWKHRGANFITCSKRRAEEVYWI